MRKLFLLGLTLILFVSCQQYEQRYFDDSAEIETIKQLYQYIEDNNTAEIRAMYSDTAKIYRNSEKSVTIDELMASNEKSRENFSMFTFKDSVYPEMVITKTGHKWVNTWPVWVGKVKGSEEELTVPAHLTFRFEDGKIVEDYGYWNALPIYLELQKVAASETEDGEEEGDDKTE